MYNKDSAAAGLRAASATAVVAASLVAAMVAVTGGAL